MSGRSPQGAERTTAPLSGPENRSAPEETPRRAPGPAGTAPTASAQAPAEAPAPGQAPGTGSGTEPGQAPAEQAATGRATPIRRATRRVRRTAAVIAVLATGAVILAALNSGTRHGHLDPRSADPSGSRAVAELLKDRGVATRVVTTAREAAAATGPRTTLLVTDPDRLGATQRSVIRSAIDLSGGRTVLLAPGDHSLSELSPGVRTAGDAPDDVLAPRCDLPAATSAVRAATGGNLRYTTALPGTEAESETGPGIGPGIGPGATACYPSGGRPTLLVLPTGTTGGDTVLLGSETILLNESLAEEGNASLALQLLGSRPDLVWYMPSLADSDPSAGSGDEDKSLFELVPPGWSWALLQLFVAAVLAALWRARRLGPLVTEKLPVAVRASETTEGRARLYRKAGARDRASTVLRAATRERLAALVGVPPAQAHDPAALVPAVSGRLTGEPRDVTALLFGTAPSDDAALVALADHLDALEREVRTS
ncbi:DUF4350 domain-containing protein [Streptomyces yangpuensis]|uniref:DUF4350 domain-containing protein n=1 Tax=Streptomyces yangpuensis TaxID=1648182 RepID=A0ABY5PW32_9ACTN|nr:DUF4350 domain-containing protein [Streptomyces yangpuensis]UUY48107.1 DUF4350 domain-containing protein [Streptomyces yangpuensis]